MKKENDIKKDLHKLKTNRQFLTVLILLFVAVFFWIVVTLLNSQAKTEVSHEFTILAKPLTPHLDMEILKKIQAKKSYSDKELSQFTIYKNITTRDGKTEKIVPIEISIDDLEPTPKPSNKPSEINSLLINDETKVASDESK